MTKEIVVARYNENISWLEQIDPEYKRIIYNKGKDDLPYNSIKVKNIGGDAQTYLYHIVSRYETLADTTIFVQGTPFDHCVKTIEIINSYNSTPFMYLADFICTESINGWYEHLIKRRPQECPITYLRDTVFSILGPKSPETLTFGAGQQFIVSKEIIYKRTKDFYKSILDRFDTEFLLPWHIERLWGNILYV